MKRELEIARIFDNLEDIRRYTESISIAQGRVRDSMHALFGNRNDS